LCSGNYSVTVTDAGGNNTIASVNIVAANISTIASAGINTTISQGNSTTLSATGGGTYLWNTGQTDSLITVTPSVTSVYCVTVSNANNCTDSSCVTVTILEPIPDCANAK
jgi:hypothetical protein